MFGKKVRGHVALARISKLDEGRITWLNLRSKGNTMTYCLSIYSSWFAIWSIKSPLRCIKNCSFCFSLVWLRRWSWGFICRQLHSGGVSLDFAVTFPHQKWNNDDNLTGLSQKLGKKMFSLRISRADHACTNSQCLVYDIFSAVTLASPWNTKTVKKNFMILD